VDSRGFLDPDPWIRGDGRKKGFLCTYSYIELLSLSELADDELKEAVRFLDG
jgi:hypothetical protein